MSERPAIVMTEREHLVRAIKDGLRKIDEHDRKIEEQETKRDEREVEVGTALKALKAQKPKSIKWEQYLEECGIEIHRSRADQLIRIADGRTTVEEERADTAERVAKSRTDLPIRSGENAGEPEGSDMPTEAEAEESFQITLYDHASHLVERMDGKTRHRFLGRLGFDYSERLSARPDKDHRPRKRGRGTEARERRTPQET